MTASTPLFDPQRNPLFRENYRPLDYKIPSANLHIALDKTATVVTNVFDVNLNAENPKAGGPLILNGENLILKELQIEESGVFRDLDISEYQVTDKHLVIKQPPAGSFKVRVVTEINPEENMSLSGIYMAGNILCSQCESEGFRRISYFIDRPDNLAVFTTTLEADKNEFPVLLSNGNGDYKKTTDVGQNRHAVTWVDPWPKPSYLFAVVGANLEVLEDTYITASGKKVDLRIFVEPGYEDKIGWAMESIKRSMKWDEDTYGLEYDLDCFHVVAVDKFNAGAMENKGLNIFNIKYLVGTPETSTDTELIYIEAIIAHEYFHNYTGDRVTVRDWFELTLKEGLTVYRDAQFTSDMHSASIKTLDDAIMIRSIQFAEDAGPNAHPIRPDSLEQADNIYTKTVYYKGAAVLRALNTVIGQDAWTLGVQTYLKRFDSQAVTCDDFMDVIEEVSGMNLEQFRTWYSQSGTPEISYKGAYDAKNKTYTLTLSQKTPPTPDQKVKKPLHIPVNIGLIGTDGKDIPLRLETDSAETLAKGTRTLHLKNDTQTFVFKDVNGPVVPSVLRDFSAPVKVVTEPSQDELRFRMAHDSDPYNRYEACERLLISTIHSMVRDIEAGVKPQIDKDVIAAYGANALNALHGDMSFNALMLSMPEYNLITQDMRNINPEHVETAVKELLNAINQSFGEVFVDIYSKTRTEEPYDLSPEQVGMRALNSVALGNMIRSGTISPAVALEQYQTATNMTDKYAAMRALCQSGNNKAEAERVLNDFYETYKDNNTLIDKWLTVQAVMNGAEATARIAELKKHPAYDDTNPNKVRALVGAFATSNPCGFHAADGSGYKLVADTILELNKTSAYTGAWMTQQFGQALKYDQNRQSLIRAEMERILAEPGLDSGIREIAGKTLDMLKPKQAGKKPGPSAPFGNVA